MVTNAVTSTIAKLKATADNVKNGFQVGKQTVDDWCAQMKEKFIDSPKRKVQEKLQPTIDKINELLEIPEVRVGLAIASAVVALATYGSLDAGSQHAVLTNVQDQIVWYIQDRVYLGIDEHYGEQIDQLRDAFDRKTSELQDKASDTVQQLKNQLDNAIAKIVEKMQGKKDQKTLEDVQQENEKWRERNRIEQQKYTEKNIRTYKQFRSQ